MASAQPTPSYPDGLEILRAAFASLAVGVVVCNAHGQLIFFNPEAERILGIGVTGAREAEWPATYGCYLPDMTTPMPGEELPLARALRGEDTARELIFIRNQRQPSGIWIDVTGRPLRDRKGALAGAVVVFSDVSMPQQLLRRTSAAMTAFPREPQCAVEDAGQGISARFAGIRDMCVQLCSAVEQTADSVIITDSRGVIQYVNPAFEATTGYSAAEVLGRTPRILKSGKHDDQFYTDLWRRLLAGEAYRGSLINRKKSGELYWAEQTINPIRNDGDEITHFVSVVKDLTTLREKQEQEFHLQLAREVQQRYYTLIPPAIPGFDIAGTAHAAVETGGDYFDFLPQPDGSLYLVIADVVGHGFGSALIMAETRAALRAYVSMVSDIRCLLKLMNRDLVGSLGANRFVTMLLARLDPTNRVLEYASAGHEPGYVLRCSGEFETLDSTAPPLGLFADGDFGARVVVPLNEGDTVVLLTDGITESTNGQDDPLGVGAVLDCIARNPDDSADLLVERLYEMARSFSGNGRQLDDMTSIICKVGTPG